MLDSAKPRPQDPCNTPLIKPRDRAGQDSIASAAPAGHSAPIPMPSSARTTNRNVKLGEKPARRLQIAYHRMEIISGARRPKFLRDRRHDQQEDGEIERVQCPA